MTDLTVSYLRECFTLDEATGKLFWRERPRAHFPTARGWNTFNAQRAGCEAGTLHSNGYVAIQLGGHIIYAHVVVYALVNGEWAPDTVDHWNRKRADNRPFNLRAATNSQQKQNGRMHSDNRSGFLGVSWHKNAGLWHARITTNGKTVSLGYFDDPAKAAARYAAAKADFHHYQPEVQS